jgi:hypothetical protein
MHDPGMEARVERLEQDMREVKAALGRLEPMVVSIFAQMAHVATKAEFAALRGEMKAEAASLRGELARKPGIAAMWTMGLSLFTLVVAAMAAGAAYLPLISHSLQTTG